MKRFCLLFVALTMIFLATDVLADLITSKAVLKNDGSENISAIASFPEPVEGDLYIAIQINNEYVFFINEGSEFSSEPVPFRENSQFEDDILVLYQPIEDIAPGQYPLFKVITHPGASPLDSRNWVGGINGLSRINFSIGLSAEESNDLDGDGFPDDDFNRDGYRDIRSDSKAVSKAMSVTIKLTRESSSGNCYAYIVENNQRILTEGEPPLYADSRTSYTISKETGICYIYKTTWLQFLGATLPFIKKWLQEGNTRNYP